MTESRLPRRSILIINPNSTTSMTEALKPLVSSLAFDTTEHAYFTASSGPRSINNDADAAASAAHCLPQLIPLLPAHDAFLVCCYSAHPLVALLKSRPEIADTGKPVTGIFEASVATSLQVVHPAQRFGIVSTGKVWEALLGDAVEAFLGGGRAEVARRFAGVQTTGLDATQLHDAPAHEVRSRMKDAVKRLLRTPHVDGGGGVGVVCLGCAGMAGMDEMVREACVEELGEAAGTRVRIVDGVVAGVAWLEGALRSAI